MCIYILRNFNFTKKMIFFFMKEYFFYKVMCVFEWCNSINDTAVSICQCTSKDKSVMNSSSQSATSVTEVVYNLCAILNSHFCSWRVCVQFLNFDTDIFYEYKLFVIRYFKIIYIYIHENCGKSQYEISPPQGLVWISRKMTHSISVFLCSAPDSGNPYISLYCPREWPSV